MQRRSLFEVNASLLVKRFGRQLRKPQLAAVTADYWRRLARLGFDCVWLMGIWQRSAAARMQALQHPSLAPEYERALPGWTEADIDASPYAIAGYDIDSRFGDSSTLKTLHTKLNRIGVSLILDFVPNHVARDHLWTVNHPERLVLATEDAWSQSRDLFFTVGDRHIAHGKDPNFPPWTDTAQLNFFSPELRSGLIEELLRIASYCDGVRCDMAMLALNEVFENTWGWVEPGARPASEFWSDAISAVRRHHPNFLFIAEAYWGLEPRLLELGFDFTYDRAFSEVLRDGDAAAVRAHLEQTPPDRSVHFLENHDEERAATAFGERHRAAAVIVATLPGIQLIHDGQCEGRRIRLPVQLQREPTETTDDDLLGFYARLLPATAGRPNAEWSQLPISVAWDGNPSHLQLLAWQWQEPERRLLAVINFSPTSAQGRIRINNHGGGMVQLRDLLTAEIYERSADELAHHGLYVDLEPWGAHLLTWVAAEPNG